MLREGDDLQVLVWDFIDQYRLKKHVFKRLHHSLVKMVQQNLDNTPPRTMNTTFDDIASPFE